MTTALAVLTLALSIAFDVHGPSRALARSTAVYRGHDLFNTHWWRLPASALLSQSISQLVWTLLLMATLFVYLEVLIGPLRFLALVISAHVLPTVAVDLTAVGAHWRAWIQSPDYGTSCLIMGVIAAVLVLTRNRLLLITLAGVLIADCFLNSVMTVTEHVLALMISAYLCRVLTRHVRSGHANTRPDARPASIADSHLTVHPASASRADQPQQQL